MRSMEEARWVGEVRRVGEVRWMEEARWVGEVRRGG